jgi:hypothetical protein
MTILVDHNVIGWSEGTMSVERREGLEGDSSRGGYKTTRRSLLAAVSVLGAMLAERKAHAMARPPRGGHHGGRRCFLRGTRILTPTGEVKVEELAVGDLVTTLDGTAKPIEGIGRWSYPSGSAERWPGEVLPIKVARSALGPSVPHTDLFLSASHALYIDGLLVPVRNLVNGSTIAHCSTVDCDTIEYFHIELAAHDVVFSEGAATETLWADAPFARKFPANRSGVILSRLRSAVSPWVDVRRPGDGIWERLARRAESRSTL